MAQLQETRLERDDHTREAPDTGVAGLIERLPHKQRRVLLLTYGWGYGATEIAEILGTSADAVRHLRHRTLRTLTPRLAHLR
jgi:DNA-directed RNA polymerase specialized sigma24 family protein